MSTENVIHISPSGAAFTAPMDVEPQDSPRASWLEERRKGIGGSDAAAMLNEGYGCTRRLVYDKRKTAPDYQRSEEEMETLLRGTELEDLIADKWSRLTGIKIRRQPARVSKSHPHARVNMDRQILQLTPDQSLGVFGMEMQGPGVLECKSCNEFVFKNIQKGGLPTDYVLQAQHAMAVTGYKWAAFACLGFGPALWRLLWFPVFRNDELCRTLLETAEETWKLVEFGPLPDPLPSNDKRCRNCQFRKTCRGEEFLASQFADAGTGKYEADESLAEVVHDYVEAKRIREEYEGTENAIKTVLQKALGARSKVEVPSIGVKISYAQTAAPMRWDTKALEAEHPELSEKYKRPGTPSRPLKVMEL